MSEADWCCGSRDCNGLWFNHRYSLEDWVQMFAALARRFAKTAAVVGFGLKNEPRAVCSGPYEGGFCNISFTGTDGPEGTCVEPAWSSGPEHLRYRPAVEQAGRAALREKPSLLISVSGLEYSSNLTAAALDPVQLPAQNLVYEVHEYSWFHHESEQQNFDCYASRLDELWGFVLRNRSAPLIVTEFGMSHDWYTDNSTRTWFDLWARYAQGEGPHAGGLDWAYWQLTGVQVGGTSRTEGDTETFGVLNHCWTAAANDKHFAAIRQLMEPPKHITGRRPDAPRASHLDCLVVVNVDGVSSVRLGPGILLLCLSVFFLHDQFQSTR
eukprot:gnl/TRDRNA2_/TRDRNA2_152776_c0_seq2.p1 gnl/TRDRNA2_/TRDRNA2_152776_c0~~gnl/TRDRNA2_/TRDRNA2_152776_c0_seq2.p1  ORF type:complete len:369 (+),score=31.42 gnl/TRDRNA2_/TRDRNA2_152776_c0_seq2:135-1109(+)